MISVCIITKNEKDKLLRCLNALRAYPLEIVVVDTGSEDGTAELLRQWDSGAATLKQGFFEWCRDFSKARNYSVSLASNDRILVLDSDETVIQLDLEALERHMDEKPDGLGRICIRSESELQGVKGYSDCYISRFFDRRLYTYTGSVHEQLTPLSASIASADKHYDTGVIALHDGYMGDEDYLRMKSLRNIELLQAELAEHGDDPYILYHLGKNYWRIHDAAVAADYFSRALSFDLDPRLEYVIDMVEAYGYLLINSGRAQEALGLEAVCEEFGHLADFRLLMGHIYMQNAMFDEAVDMFLRATQCSTAKTFGANSHLAYYNAGVICEVLGRTAEARRYYRKCGDYAPAAARLKEL